MAHRRLDSPRRHLEEALINSPRRLLDASRREAASLVMQACARGYLVRKSNHVEMALRLQARWRAVISRRKTARLKTLALKAEEARKWAEAEAYMRREAEEEAQKARAQAAVQRAAAEEACRQKQREEEARAAAERAATNAKRETHAAVAKANKERAAKEKAEAEAQAIAKVRNMERLEAAQARAAAEKAREAAEAAALRTCCVCFDEVDVAAGVECAGRPAHFLCDPCFGHHTLAYAQDDLHVLVARSARLFCPERRKQGGVWQCCAEYGGVEDFPAELAYANETVAAHVPAAAFEALLHARERVQEQQLAQQFEQLLEQRMEAERRRIQELREDELRVEQTARHIQEKILTLHCPRCDLAFLDFNGCFALTCHGCPCSFCAYCLKDCGNNAHQHVLSCQHRLQEGYGGDVAQFEKAQRCRRQRMVHEYLRTVGDDIRQRVIAACQPHFDDLGLAPIV